MRGRNQTKKSNTGQVLTLRLASLLLLGLLFAGVMVFLIWNVVHKAEQKMRAGLLQQIRDSSQTVDIDLLKTFSGTISDEDRPEYRYLKGKFEFAIQMNSKLRYIYLLGRKPGQRVFFFMDTGQPEDREEEARPGDFYDDVPDEVIRVFDSNAEVVIGPYTDKWGTFISGIAPLIDPQTDNVLAVMGIDVDYSDWSRNVFFAAVPLATVFVAVLLVFITILTFLVIKLAASLRQRDAVADALKNQKDRYAYILEGTDVGTWEWNVQTGEAVFNERFVDMAGYSLAELAPISFKTWESLAHPDDLKASNEALERHFQGETNFYESECRIKHKDGRWVWVLDRGKVISRTEDGKPLWVYGTHQDITERKRAEEALLQSEVRARAQRTAIADLSLDKEVLEGELPSAMERITETVAKAMNVARTGIWMLSDDRSELRCLSLYEAEPAHHSNGMVLETTAFPRYLAAILSESRIFAHDAQTDPRTSELSEGYLLPMNITSMLDAGIQIDGRLAGVVCLEHIGEPRRWHSDEEAFVSTVAALVAQVMTNARRRSAEQEHERLQSQLLQAQKMESVGILAGGVAHDFNNLLQVMRGNMEMLVQRTFLDSEAQSRIRIVTKSMDRAARLVSQLLLFSRKAESQKVCLDLNQEVEGMVRMLERTIPKMISLEKKLDPSVCSVFADPVQIEQVLLNLANNAADAMPDGGKLTIETGNVELDQDFVRRHPGSSVGRHACLTVIDTGCGMDKTTLEHVFDPFFTTKEKGQGTGLGLASVYGIVKAHGGHIQCSSKPDLGTTFLIYLPACEQGGMAKAELEQTASFQGGDETILVVDDESDIRKLTAESLEMLGYVVQYAATGEEALQVFQEHGNTIDLVLLDLNMPGMGGYTCLKELLRIAPEVKVVIASGYTANSHGKDALSSGAKSFIGKPYQLKELAAVVRAVLDG